MIPQHVQRGISMNKNKKNNIKVIQNQNKRKVSYFDKEEERNGQSWLSSKTQADMYRDAKYIIRDLVKGNIDIEKHCHYFNDNIIINIVKREADNNVTKHQCIVDAMTYHINNMRIQNILPNYAYMSVYQEEMSMLSLYQSLSKCFANILTNQDAYAQLNILYGEIRSNASKHSIEDITY